LLERKVYVKGSFTSFAVVDHRLKKANEYESLITIVLLRQCHSFVGCMIVWSPRILRNNMADQLVVGECNFFPVSSTQDTGLTRGLKTPWVEVEVAAMPPGLVGLSIFIMD
jgi:hypothetical protein